MKKQWRKPTWAWAVSYFTTSAGNRRCSDISGEPRFSGGMVLRQQGATNEINFGPLSHHSRSEQYSSNQTIRTLPYSEFLPFHRTPLSPRLPWQFTTSERKDRFGSVAHPYPDFRSRSLVSSSPEELGIAGVWRRPGKMKKRAAVV